MVVRHLVVAAAFVGIAGVAGLVMDQPLIPAAAFVVVAGDGWFRRSFDAWSVGAGGERRVERTLAPLASRGFVVVHDLDAGRGNVGHVVVGPTGVFAIETKAWRGRAWLGKGAALMVSGTDRSAALSQAKGGTREVRRRWDGIDAAPWIEPVVVLTNVRWRSPASVRGVAVVGVADLVSHIEKRPATLAASDVARLSAPLVASASRSAGLA